jgi:predicted acyltransferase
MSDAAPSATVPAQAEAQSPSKTTRRRLLSLDALRGFDMFWIVGGEEIIHAIHKAWPNAATAFVSAQWNHKDWQGVAFYDLIFPLFVFIVGVSLVFSLSRTIEQQGKAQALRRIFVRALWIYVFGLLVYGGISKGIDQVRWLGVLQRIAIAYFAAGLLFCLFRLRGLFVTCVALLIGYWALMSFVPIRDFNLSKTHLQTLQLTPASPETRARFEATTERVRGKFEDGRNLAQHFDFQYLPGHKWDGAYDPEGLLSTLPAIATCLLGVFAGFLLKSQKVADSRKVVLLVAAGVTGVVLGFAWGLQFPVIKKIWTSSYVLVAGGYACLFLAAFYQVVEIWGWRKWCTPFVWIGMNPITIYLVWHLVSFEKLASLVAGGPVHDFFGSAGDLVLAVVASAMVFGLTRFLYNRKIFLRF